MMKKEPMIIEVYRNSGSGGATLGAYDPEKEAGYRILLRE